MTNFDDSRKSKGCEAASCAFNCFKAILMIKFTSSVSIKMKRDLMGHKC